MKWKSVVVLAMFTCSLLQPLAGPTRAAVGDEQAAGTSSDKFWDYAMCGASIVFATGTGGWILAAITCGRAVSEHWTD